PFPLPKEQEIFLRVHISGPLSAQPHDCGALEIFVAQVDVLRSRQIEAVPRELDPIDSQATLRAGVVREDDGLAIHERPAVVANLYGNRRTARSLVDHEQHEL